MRKNYERLGFGLKCPVCDNINTSMLCLKCGFDSSRDYEKYPTFGAVGKVPSASALRREWLQNHPVEEPVIIPTPPQPEPKKKKPWLIAAACAAMLALGIGIGAGLTGGKTEPTEPKESVTMQEPPETTTPPETTAPPETTEPEQTVSVSGPQQTNVLRSDEMPDDYDGSGDGTYSVFGSEYQREDIASVTFLDTLADLPDDAWDVSEDGNGKVMAWVEPNGRRYDLYIGAEGGVWAGESCRLMFESYINASEITFGDAFHTENVQDMTSMFGFCYELTDLNLNSFNTANVRDMGGMFRQCGSLTSLDLSSINTANVQDMNGMFWACYALTDLDLSGFDTAKVENMSGMFLWCGKLNGLDLSSFNTSKVRDMEKMFEECDALNSLKLSDGFVTTNADTTDMFTNCPAGDDYQHLVN